MHTVCILARVYDIMHNTLEYYLCIVAYELVLLLLLLLLIEYYLYYYAREFIRFDTTHVALLPLFVLLK